MIAEMLMLAMTYSPTMMRSRYTSSDSSTFQSDSAWSRPVDDTVSEEAVLLGECDLVDVSNHTILSAPTDSETQSLLDGAIRARDNSHNESIEAWADRFSDYLSRLRD